MPVLPWADAQPPMVQQTALNEVVAVPSTLQVADTQIAMAGLRYVGCCRAVEEVEAQAYSF